jgi:hypothetical protein
LGGRRVATASVEALVLQHADIGIFKVLIAMAVLTSAGVQQKSSAVSATAGSIL